MSDALKQLSEEGVAIWLDDLSRHRLVSGSLDRLIREKSVVGVTSNPTIFQKATLFNRKSSIFQNVNYPTL